jgi:serine/threonine-protein kinase
MPQLTEELRAAFAGHYAIEREISRSAMAAVFLASDVRHDRPVAIKVLDREFAGETGVERFRREIQVVARFQHPHILPLFESGEAAGALFYVMPYVEGETLRGRISREGVLAVDEAVRIASEICDALSYAHAQGIVHRDIKPENILLNGPHALVLDFGIARLLQRTGTGSVTASGIVVGTPAYMSPEQASGEFELDGRSDIYSLACVLYEMLSGSPPHHSRSPQMMLAARLQTPARPLRELNRPIPPVLDAAVQRALALDPRDRYTSANEFAAALQLGLAPVTPYPTVREQTRRVRGRVIAMLVAIAVLLAIGVYQVVRNRAPSPPLDAKAVVILPMLHQLSTNAFPLDGDNCARLLYDAFSRWTGIHLVNDMLVREMREREGGSVKDVESAVRIGRQLGARYVAWGNVIGSPGEVNVRVALYDVKDKRAAPAAQVVISRGDDLPQRFATLADSLVRGVVSGASAVGGADRVVVELDAVGEFGIAAQTALEAIDLANRLAEAA